MRRIGASLAALTVAVFGSLVIASPAQAHHNEVTVNLVIDGCDLTATSEWKIQQHQVTNTRLVVLAGGVVTHKAVGELLEVDLPPGTTEVQWRVWGGAERNYDDPALTDLSALLDYITTGSPLDPDVPGVAWYTEKVEDCPAPEPTPEPEETTTTATTTTTGGALANTGTSLTTLLVVAAILVVAGAAVLVLARRRRT